MARPGGLVGHLRARPRRRLRRAPGRLTRRRPSPPARHTCGPLMRERRRPCARSPPTPFGPRVTRVCVCVGLCSGVAPWARPLCEFFNYIPTSFTNATLLYIPIHIHSNHAISRNNYCSS